MRGKRETAERLVVVERDALAFGFKKVKVEAVSVRVLVVEHEEERVEAGAARAGRHLHVLRQKAVLERGRGEDDAKETKVFGETFKATWSCCGILFRQCR